MWHAHNEKWKKTNNERNRTTKSRKNQNSWREEKLRIVGNIRSGYHQTSGDERKKSEKNTPDKQKTSGNQVLWQKSH